MRTESQRHPAQTPSHGSHGQSLTRVLLVDDDEDAYVLTGDLLSEAQGSSFNLEWVSDFETALEVMSQNRHDICLVDYRLGDHSGLALLREARRKGCEAPVIFLTGSGDREVDVEAMEAGAADYLEKGRIDLPLLERSIRYTLQHTKMEKEAARETGHILAAMQSVGDGLIVTDTSGKVVLFNKAAEGLTGWTRDEAAGKHANEVLRTGGARLGRPPPVVEQVLATDVSVDLKDGAILVARDGTERVISGSAAPVLDAEGNVTGVVLTFRDAAAEGAEERSRAGHPTDEELRAACRALRQKGSLLAGGLGASASAGGPPAHDPDLLGACEAQPPSHASSSAANGRDERANGARHLEAASHARSAANAASPVPSGRLRLKGGRLRFTKGGETAPAFLAGKRGG